MKLTALVCGVALGGLLASNAQAADLLYSQPAPAMAQNYGGPYVGIKGGYNSTDDDSSFDVDGDATLETIDTEDGFNASVVAGYAFGSRWGFFSPRLEAELGYLSNDIDSFDADGAAGVAAVAADGEYNANYGLVNLLLDIPMGWGFTPFIGAGVGYANVRFDNVDATPGVAGGIVLNEEDTTFAWNLTAGISYDISRNVTLEVAYRYLQFSDVELEGIGGTATVEDDVDNHQVNVGVRVHL